MRLILAGLFALSLVGAPLDFRESDFQSGWTTWAPRDEIAPKTAIEPAAGLGGGPALSISGAGNPAVYGGWHREVGGVTAGHWYRLEAYFRRTGLPQPRQNALARIAWRQASGKRASWPHYAHQFAQDGEWTRVTLEAQAPKDASAAVIQLYLANAADGALWWDSVSLEEIPAPSERKVKVASVNLQPRGSETSQDNVSRFLETIEANVPQDADIVLLPEGITIVGVGGTYADVAEPIPGPTTQRLGEAARSKNAYIVAGIYEREGVAVYNTSVLIDRQGELVGKYRKVYLPREEITAGITPGDDYPVFDTDFGKVGMMICWDVQYADPARALALRGAELLLMPIWGGNETLAAARAIENHVFLAASGYDHPTYVMDPKGELLAKAYEQGDVAVATIDLSRRYSWQWLGEMRGRFFHEIRRDVEVSER